ncbi:MAG: SRPBCC family protein [Nitrososphaeraceae archaeon]
MPTSESRVIILSFISGLVYCCLLGSPSLSDNAMMKSRMMNTSINSNPQVVYDFVSNLENLPRWASSTFSSIKEVNGEWVVDTPQGRNKVMLAERNNFGILDHHVKLTSGVEVYVPMRVVKNGNGSEVMLTVFQTPEMIDERYAEDIKTVEKDLNHLKIIIEEC